MFTKILFLMLAALVEPCRGVSFDFFFFKHAAELLFFSPRKDTECETNFISEDVDAPYGSVASTDAIGSGYGQTAEVEPTVANKGSVGATVPGEDNCSPAGRSEDGQIATIANEAAGGSRYDGGCYPSLTPIFPFNFPYRFGFCNGFPCGLSGPTFFFN